MKKLEHIKGLLKNSLGLTLMVLLSGVSIAAATLTFTGTKMTGDAATTIDVGAGNTLHLQDTNNGAITTGSGLVTVPLILITNGSSTNFAIVNASTTNVSSTNINNTGYITFVSASGTNIGISNVSSTNVSSTRMDVTGSSTLGAVAIGTSTTPAILTIGGGQTGSNCIAFYINSTSTLLYLSVSTTTPGTKAGYEIVATSSKPANCN